MDLFISTEKFESQKGRIRRVTEISEVLKDWKDEPQYVTLFSDKRSEDTLKPINILKGDKELIEKVNSFDLSEVDVLKAAENLNFLPPDESGSQYISKTCERLAIDSEIFLKKILAEAKMKSYLLQKYRKTSDSSYLELSFTRKAYDQYSAILNRAPSLDRALAEFEEWLSRM